MIKRIVLVFGAWLVVVLPSMGEPKKYPSVADLQVDSESIGSVILDQKIKLSMRDGSYLEGKVLRAGRKEIVLRISKLDLKGPSVAAQKGKEVMLKTSDIGIVYLRKSGTVAGPVALGVIGGILGAAASAYALRYEESPAAGLTGFVAATAGGATGGALLGREVVKRSVTIYVTSNNH